MYTPMSWEKYPSKRCNKICIVRSTHNLKHTRVPRQLWFPSPPVGNKMKWSYLITFDSKGFFNSTLQQTYNLQLAVNGPIKKFFLHRIRRYKIYSNNLILNSEEWNIWAILQANLRKVVFVIVFRRDKTKYIIPEGTYKLNNDEGNLGKCRTKMEKVYIPDELLTVCWNDWTPGNKHYILSRLF